MTNEQFLARVEPDANSGCWLWAYGGRTSDGYGTAQHTKKTLLAHRVSWMLHHGEIPAGHSVCHKCDTPACVNPAHLFTATQAENMADMRAKGRADRKHGARNGRAKLSNDQAMEILTLSKMGLFSKSEIARSYGVAPSSVARVITGETFSHIIHSRALIEASHANV
jgi:hypothetical protein